MFTLGISIEWVSAQEEKDVVGPPVPKSILEKNKKKAEPKSDVSEVQNTEFRNIETLWKSEGLKALQAIAEFYGKAQLKDLPAQEAFELAREVAIKAPQNPLGGAAMRKLIKGYLTLPKSTSVTLPGESFRAPWHVQLRLVLGLRSAQEVGPLLVQVAKQERESFEKDPSKGVSDSWRNAIYMLGFYRYEIGLEELIAFSKIEDGRDLGAQMLGQLRHLEGGKRLEEILNSPLKPQSIAVVSAAIVLCWGQEATPSILDLLKVEDEGRYRALVTPLIQLANPESLQALIKMNEKSDLKRLQKALNFQLGRYAKGVGLTKAQLIQLIDTEPQKASDLISPLAHLLDKSRPDDQELSAKDLISVIKDWTHAKTLYVEKWKWVRDRHIIAAAKKAKNFTQVVQGLGQARIAFLSEYRKTCVNEAEVVQRILASVQRQGWLATASAEGTK